jgi:hypothetical protein
MDTSDIRIERSGNSVIVARSVTFMGGELPQMQEGETLTVDVAMELDVDELAKLIDKNDPTKPGWAQRFADAFVTEG